MEQTTCPRCGSTNITFQREQTGSIGAGTNKVTIQTEKGARLPLLGYYRMVVETIIFYYYWLVVEPTL